MSLVHCLWLYQEKMTLKTDAVNHLKLPEVVGKGYASFWNFKGRYRVCKGSRASKKSKTTALWYIVNMMKYHKANLLVVRKSYRTLKDSCFTELRWAIHRLGVDDFWDYRLNPLEIIYKPTGQKIYFRGLDDPLKVTSITVDVGSLCWLWIEEAYEISKEADFDMLDESIRGQVDGDLFKQVTVTFNPWNERHWLKRRFFDNPDPDTLAITTNYLCNEWLDKADFAVFERMKQYNPRRYNVAGLGNWGVVEGVVYERWKEEAFSLTDLPKDVQSAFGLDFGYTNDPSALFCGYISIEQKRLFVWDELYKKGLSNKAIYDEIDRLGYTKERITADCAEPKSIDELKGLGIRRIEAAKKGKDSVNNGIQWIQDLEIIIHPRCVNFLLEISLYSWRKDKFGKALNEPEDDNNHLMDAMRYALEKYIQKNKWLI